MKIIIILKKNNINTTKLIAALLLMFLITLCLSAQAEEPDYGNDCTSAQPVVTDGSNVEGILSDGSDEDWFSFTAVAEGLYEMTLYSQSGYKSSTLYGPDGCGGTLQGITSFPSYGGTVTQDVFIQTAGTYYIQVSSGSGLYRVSVDAVASYPTDTYPDTCLNTDTVSLVVGGDPVSDSITNYGIDEDWFTFATIPLHKYQVSLSYQPVNSDVVYELYETDCGIDLSGSRNSLLTFISLEGADYDLRLHSSSFVKEGYYEIEVADIGTVPTDDYGNSCSSADPITANGVQVQGVLQYTSDLVNDEDWFSFTAVAEALYEMALFSEADYKYFTLYGPNGCGGTLQGITSFPSYGGTVTQDVFIHTAGTYYIQVGSGSGLYSISVESSFNPQCGDSSHPYPVGDMNTDCIVDFGDFAIFATHWLEDNRP